MGTYHFVPGSDKDAPLLNHFIVSENNSSDAGAAEAVFYCYGRFFFAIETALVNLKCCLRSTPTHALNIET